MAKYKIPSKVRCRVCGGELPRKHSSDKCRDCWRMYPPTWKRCSCCLKVWTISHFRTYPESLDGYGTECRSCNTKRVRSGRGKKRRKRDRRAVVTYYAVKVLRRRKGVYTAGSFKHMDTEKFLRALEAICADEAHYEPMVRNGRPKSDLFGFGYDAYS